MSRTEYPDLEKFPRTGWLRATILPLIVLAAGISLTLSVFLLDRSREEQHVRQEFERVASDRVSTLRRIVERSVHALESLRSFHNASHEVERKEFRDFVQPLLVHNPAIQALEWIPRVPRHRREAVERAAREEGLEAYQFTERGPDGTPVRAGDRDVYFPVYYLEPYRGNEVACGFDLGSDPTRLEALRKACETGRATATSRVRLIQETGRQYGFLLFLPVYRGHSPGDPPAPEGLVLGVFRAGDLLESGLAYLENRGIEFCVLDHTAPEGERFLHAISGDTAATPRRPESDIPPPGGLSLTQTVRIGGREWVVDCRPTPEYLSSLRRSTPLLLLIGGLLTSALIAGIVQLLIVRVDRTRRHAMEILGAKETLEREIAERRQAEERVQLLTTAVEQTSEGLAVSDLEGRLLFVNPAFAEMHGWLVDELEGAHLSVFHNPEQMPAVEAAIRQTVSKGRFVGEVPHVRRNGEVFPGVMTGTLLRDEPGRPVAIVATLRDITRQKEIEGELRKAEKLESVGQLAGGIAHDFNNLLTGILGNINLARVRVDQGTKVHRRLVEAERASSRAQELTQQLLTFSRGGAPVKETLSIGDLVRETVGFTLRGSNVRCEFDIAEDLRPVDVDEGQISRVIGNLTLNGAQAMPGGGVLSVTCRNLPPEDDRPAGDRVRVSIHDRGRGIPDDQIGKVFDPYFTTKQEGSGLGLTSAYSIVRNHGGRITVESKVGVGSVFHITLPASQHAIRRPEEIRAGRRIAGARVLVMDDEEMVREVAAEMVEALGGQVVVAEDGAEAVRAYREGREDGRPIDLVIMDLTVPGGMGGQEALEELIEIDPDVCVVVSSGYSNAPILADFRAYGFRGALVKPYTVEELSAVVSEALGESGDSNPPVE